MDDRAWAKEGVITFWNDLDHILDTETLPEYSKMCSMTALRFFIYLGFYIAFNTVQVISQRVVGRAEETSTYSSLGFCTVNCRPTASNYQLSHLRLYWGSNPGLRGGRRECYHSATEAPNSSTGAMIINAFPLTLYTSVGAALAEW